jgi:hypothetical protein
MSEFTHHLSWRFKDGASRVKIFLANHTLFLILYAVDEPAIQYYDTGYTLTQLRILFVKIYKENSI